MPKAQIESFWDALWLGIRPCLCFIVQKSVNIDFLKLNLLLNEPIESFWDALWLGIQPFLCFTIESRKVVQGHLVVVEN